MKKICIFGSCVSRDIIEYDMKNNFELIDYYARSSFASLASSAMIEQSVLDNIQSSFQKRMVLRLSLIHISEPTQKRMVLRDMDKSFIRKLKKMILIVY